MDLDQVIGKSGCEHDSDRFMHEQISQRINKMFIFKIGFPL